MAIYLQKVEKKSEIKVTTSMTHNNSSQQLAAVGNENE